MSSTALSLAMLLFAMPPDIASDVLIDMPAILAVHLDQADAAVEFAGWCAQEHPQLGLEGQVELRDRRYWALRSDIDEIWSVRRHEDIDIHPYKGRHCRKSTVLTVLAEADQFLDGATASFASAAVPLRQGLWAGPLRLCIATVKHAEIGRERMLGQLMLSVTLQQGASAAFAEITSQHIGRRLAIRTAGRVISHPTVYEAAAGALYIVNPDQAVLTQLKALTAADC